MKLKTLFGLLLGAVAFAFPLAVEIPDLALAGRLSLSIFLLAALFWQSL